MDARGERRLVCCDGNVRLVPAVPAGALRGVHLWVSVQGVSVSGSCDKFLVRDNHSSRYLDAYRTSGSVYRWFPVHAAELLTLTIPSMTTAAIVPA